MVHTHLTLTHASLNDLSGLPVGEPSNPSEVLTGPLDVGER
jgi:hypothetical protein